MSNAPVRLPARVRRRLPPDVRIGQILDAAYEAFSTHGFAHTRIDDIAALAGLSKGGIYAHFASKDEIFQALLHRSLQPIGIGKRALLRDPVTIERMVDLLAYRLYAWAVSEPAVATLRLLIAERARVPDAVEQWRRYMERTVVASIRKLIVKGVREGTLRDGIAAQSPALLIAPIAHACLREVLRTTAQNAAEINRARREYVSLLRELLATREI
ncbi:TetR/AcrR family transcriptional regulator [Trinickia acidisoli]|uniref:TetR/AcrR family transcriptional regulator n=1 Tax=Trinickia acidisoli TaxID=2767482 RepID=UPI001A90633F|nr:TetR/AcrR family transcriptional regulator [Trinickia acidisoli]